MHVALYISFIAPPLMKHKSLSSPNEINSIFIYKHLNSNDVKYVLDFFALEGNAHL